MTRSIIECQIEIGQFSEKQTHELLLYSSQLLKLLPAVSVPQWLHDLDTQFSGLTITRGHTDNRASAFGLFLMSRLSEIESPLLSPDEVQYDFDVAFAKIRDQNEIPEEFDRLVSRLEEIIAADLIDSRIVQDSLERMKVLLRRNRKGSLASILVSIHYSRFALKTFGGVLSANKYLKPMIDAFKEEFAIAESKVRDAQELLKRESVVKLTNQSRLSDFLDQNYVRRDTIAGFIEWDETGDANLNSE
jgi:hypothetical protein